MVSRVHTKKLTKIMLPIVIVIVLISILSIYLGSHTGVFDTKEIDVLDMAHWNYTNGTIDGASEKFIEGNNSTCWLLVHGYASTPKDMYLLADPINAEFGDSIYMPRLKGHGEVPSHMVSLDFNDWYAQVEREFNNISLRCEKVNVAGYSIGGALSLKLAENYHINNLYLISPYLELDHKWWMIFEMETYIKIFAELFTYTVKYDIGQINDPAGKGQQIAYLVLPLPPLSNSFSEINKIKGNLSMVDAKGLLTIHSTGDQVVDPESSFIIYNSVNVSNKEKKIFTRSNHVILFDYEKQEAIESIIDFERKTR